MTSANTISTAADDAVIPALPPVRMALLVRIEIVILVMRYLGLVLVALASAFNYKSPYVPPLAPVLVGAIVQNAWVHGVLYTRRYDLFRTRLNFYIHLLKVALLVYLTGAETSPLAFFFAMLIVGYGLYSADFRQIYPVGFLCAAVYAFVILSNWAIAGIDPVYNPIVLNFAAIGMSAWLMSNLGRMLRELELETEKRTLALASSEAMLRTILNATADPILVFNENEFVTEVNDRACDFFGLPRHALAGQRFRSLLFDDGTLPNKLAALRSRGEYWGEMIAVPDNGDERTVTFMARSFLRENRRFFVALMHDITEQKSLEESARLATLRLEQINATVQQISQMRLAFFADISKRLRSPLSAILGMTDLLLGEELGTLTPEQRQALHSCRRSAERVLELADEAMSVGSAVPESLRARKFFAGFPAEDTPVLAAPETDESAELRV